LTLHDSNQNQQILTESRVEKV